MYFPRLRTMKNGVMGYQDILDDSDSEKKGMIRIMLSQRETGEGNGTPLQYSCLENPMDGGAWQAAVHGVAKSQA